MSSRSPLRSATNRPSPIAGFRNVRARTSIDAWDIVVGGNIRHVRGEGANMLRRDAARLLNSSVEFKRQTEGVVDGLEFIETHTANKFAEPFRSYRRRLFDEYLCSFAVERDGRTK